MLVHKVCEVERFFRAGVEARRTEDRRAETFHRFFPNSSPAGRDRYLYDEHLPIVRPDDPSPLAALLLDGLHDQTIALSEINAATVNIDRLGDGATKALLAQVIANGGVDISTRVDHLRPTQNDFFARGELSGWLLAHVASVFPVTEGPSRNMPTAVLLNPSYVDLSEA